MPDPHPVVALISAVPAAIPPTTTAFEALFPAARIWNLLDDRLIDDAESTGGVHPPLVARMRRLIDHAIIEGADAVLLTCSMYASVAHSAAKLANVPVLAPDDALFQAVSEAGYSRLTVVSPAADPLSDSLHRIRQVVKPDTTVEGVIAHGAAAAARDGDRMTLAELVTAAVAASFPTPDAVVLGQYSLAPAAAKVQAATGIPTLAGPCLAVRMLRDLLSGDES